MQELINMVCTRICHDVISSSQGILQGMESLNDNDESFVEQSKLFIKESAETLNAKLIFYRALCGRAGKMVSTKELEEFCVNYLESYNRRVYKINISITGECLDLTLLKSGLAFCCIATDTLIRGGNLTLNYSNNSLECIMTGEKMKFNEDIHNVLTEETDAFEPKSAIAGYLKLVIKDAGLTLLLENSENELKFVIK